MPRQPAPPKDLRHACVEAAWAFIAENGIEKLSLREIARRLNVSHQAPYRHYASRDHLLAEVIRRCFNRFTQALDGREKSGDAFEDMRSLGRSYLAFAIQNPLEYRLMFGTPWPPVEAHADLVTDARHSFEVLRVAIRPIFLGAKWNAQQIDLEAMFVWSTMHGLATILQAQVMEHLDLKKSVLDGAVAHVMQRVELALTVSSSGLPKPVLRQTPRSAATIVPAGKKSANGMGQAKAIKRPRFRKD